MKTSEISYPLTNDGFLKVLTNAFNAFLEADCQITLSASDFGRFGQAVIVNDYEKFAQKVYHTINAL